MRALRTFRPCRSEFMFANRNDSYYSHGMDRMDRHPPRPGSRLFGPQPALQPAPATPRSGDAAPPARRLSSAELLGPARELEIAHGDALYRLRLTSLGKLILTK